MRKRLNLEPTNYCTRRCDYCGDKGTRKKGFLDLALAASIMAQFKKLDEVRLFLSGEPLLHEQLPELISLAREYADDVVINTNCELLTKAKAIKLLDAGLTKITFSYHTPKLKNKINNFLGLNNVKRNQVAVTTLLLLVPEPEEMPNKHDLAKEFRGIDYVEVRRPHNWDVRDSVEGAVPGITHKKKACWFPREFVSVYWDGRVSACCNDLNGRYILGDMNRDSLEIIESRLDDLVDRQERGESIPELCDTCERYNP